MNIPEKTGRVLTLADVPALFAEAAMIERRAAALTPIERIAERLVELSFELDCGELSEIAGELREVTL